MALLTSALALALCPSVNANWGEKFKSDPAVTMVHGPKGETSIIIEKSQSNDSSSNYVAYTRINLAREEETETLTCGLGFYRIQGPSTPPCEVFEHNEEASSSARVT